MTVRLLQLDKSDFLWTVQRPVAVLLLTGIYFLAAIFGLSLAIIHPSATAVWPPTGIALAAFLMLGSGVWPAIFVGALLANLVASGSIVASLGIATGNTLEGLIGAFLVNQFAHGARFCERPQDVGRFIVLAGLLGTTVSATIGMTSLALAHLVRWSEFGPIWVTWWLGDATGALLMTPLLVLWSGNPRVSWNQREVLEAGLLVLTLCLIAQVVFGGWLPTEVKTYPLDFLCIPLLVWAAFRFGPRETTAVTFLLSGIALWHTKRGLGPFAVGTPNESLLLLQIFMGVSAGMALAFAAVVDQRRQGETGREQLLAREQAARTAAETASRLKEEFLATVSHELRTPLTSILGWVQLLRGGRPDEATTNRALDIIERNATAQAQVIDDLLDVSRVITGRLHLEMRSVDLAAVVSAAIESVRPAAENKGIRLEAMLDPQTGSASGDPQRLQQVLWNLLSNAIKFTPKDGRVHVRLERIQSHLEVTITDSGKGISAEFLPYVFDRFRQADSSITRAHGGLGLGLAIVRHLVELHGGSVRAFSEGLDRGATFTVKLPIRIVQEISRLPPETITEPHPSAGTTAPAEDSATLDGVHLLLVEDERDAREVLTIMLESSHATVTAVASSAEAMGKLEQFTPDLLVSDIQMPVEDGYSLIRRVRALEAKPVSTIPALALTAHAREEDRVRALSAGFDSHLAKPFAREELIAVITRLARRRKPSQ